MDDGTRISWLITVVILIICAMFFAVCETAFASVSRSRIKVLADKGNTDAEKVLYVLEHFERAITTILICTNIIHIAAASIVTVNVSKIWGVSAVTLSTVITTLAVFFFGEMLPKSIARKYSQRIALSSAGILRFFMFILKPAASFLSAVGKAAAALSKGEGEVSVTEDELYDIIEDMTKEGTLDEERGDLISSALQFQDVTVESILTSRMDLAALEVSMPQEKILAVIKKENHSRLPVYEGSIDHILGILQIRKYIIEYLRKGKIDDIRPLLDKPLFVHQSAKIDDVLAALTKEKLNVAVVTDNYGGTVGIVSVEDILEELVGEIWDEDDKATENIVRVSDNLYSVSPNELVTDVLDELQISCTEEEEEALTNKLMSELTYEQFSSIPREGDSFDFLSCTVTVQTMKQNRIIRLLVSRNPQKGGEEE